MLPVLGLGAVATLSLVGICDSIITKVVRETTESDEDILFRILTGDGDTGAGFTPTKIFTSDDI